MENPTIEMDDLGIFDHDQTLSSLEMMRTVMGNIYLSGLNSG